MGEIDCLSLGGDRLSVPCVLVSLGGDRLSDRLSVPCVLVSLCPCVLEQIRGGQQMKANQ